VIRCKKRKQKDISIAIFGSDSVQEKETKGHWYWHCHTWKLFGAKKKGNKRTLAFALPYLEVIRCKKKRNKRNRKRGHWRFGAKKKGAAMGTGKLGNVMIELESC